MTLVTHDQMQPRQQAILRRIFAHREGSFGLYLISVMLIVILLGPVFAPHSPTDIDLAPANSLPDAAHLLGTDHLGRDVLSRFLWGGRSIVSIPLLSVTLSYLTGGFLALLTTYKGGWGNLIVSRIFEVMMSLPGILTTLILVAAFGPKTEVLIISLMIGNMPGASRVVQSAVISQTGLEYVQAAQVRGETTFTIVTREILPNIALPIVADFTLRITWGVVALSTLSFLGLGVQPPTADWGLMILEGRASLREAPLVVIFPAIGIALLAIGLNLTADAVVKTLVANKSGH
ncbi:ABC transporter permease [Rhizobium leguminosarum]|uniref:ABC transporter permease n=1 Tax=Rhizobium leguminosarum TaxID=384 RepID=UPI0024A7D7A4|nr:ABC transporter permease [Rhizobium leguminosarum]MDI5930011.1 ABC transporter permease [Rhizobium leguminosarum]